MKSTRLLLILPLALMLACRLTAPTGTVTPSPDINAITTDTPTAAKTITISETPASGVYDWSLLDAALASFVPGKVDGLTFLLAKNGQVIYEKALGDQTMDSFLSIPSSTKMPSAVVILTLVEDGLLNLDEPVSAYLRGSFQVAGYVAEVVSGKPWNDLFQERLAELLGLTTLTYSGGTSGSETNPRIPGGASSNVYEYYKILQMILNDGQYNGTQILSPQTIQMMTTSQISGLTLFRSPGEDDLLIGYSFGFWVSDPSIHPGSNGPELSDQGGFGCTPWVDFDLGYSAVLLIKDRTRKETEIWNIVRPIIIEEIKQ